jgi:hypothetical protein
VFVFRGKRGDLIKLLWWSGDGMNLYAKRLERGRFVWPKGVGRCRAFKCGATGDAARRYRLEGATAQFYAEHRGIEITPRAARLGGVVVLAEQTAGFVIAVMVGASGHSLAGPCLSTRWPKVL